MSRPDLNFLSFANLRPLGSHNVGDLTPPAGSCADTLKFSNCADGTVISGTIVGGSEDCVDVNNRCARLLIRAARFIPRGQALATIKGGSSEIILSGAVEDDMPALIEFGNWSDQSLEVSRRNTVQVRHNFPGRTIDIACGRAEWPTLVGPGPYRRLYLRSAALKCYWWLNRAYFALGFR